MKKALRFSIVLGLITIVSGLGVSGAYQLTRGRIASKKEKAFQAALNSVFPEADAFHDLAADTAWSGEGVGRVFSKDTAVGFLIVAEKQGYASIIKVLVGVEPDFSIKAIRILDQTETPGLGERTKEVKSDRTVWQAVGEVVGITEKGQGEADDAPWFQKQFKGLTLAEIIIVKDPNAKGIQAITGATVTSRAVTEAVKAAVGEVEKAVTAAGPSALNPVE